MLVDRSLQRKVSSLSSRVLVPTFFVVLLVPVCFPSMTRPNFSCSERPLSEALAKLLTWNIETISDNLPGYSARYVLDHITHRGGGDAWMVEAVDRDNGEEIN
jgi:hypothetical protein